MDRLKHYANLIDDDGAFVSAMEALGQSSKYYELKVTDFLTPDQVVAFEKMIQETPEIKMLSHGGIHDAERRMLFFSPDDLTTETIKRHIGIVSIQYPEKFNVLQHKDVLGALMSLGVKRKKMGDIVPVEGGFQVAMDLTLVPYVIQTLDQIGRSGVKLKEVPFENAAMRQVNYAMVDVTVKSLRLDAIIASAFHLSRSDAQDLVESECVKMNHQVQTKLDYCVSEGDLISVRRFGRFKIEGIGSQTKKDRLRIKLAMVSNEGGK